MKCDKEITDDELIKALKTISKYCTEHIAPERAGEDCAGCPFRQSLSENMKWCILTQSEPWSWRAYGKWRLNI